MQSLIISDLVTGPDDVEVVERKGLGHPDTICDALAEDLSRNLCREYRSRFGQVLHHNVDKALLCGGRAAPAFSGGAVLMPINIHLAGRAVAEVGGRPVPIGEIAVEGSKAWMRANLHALDVDRDVRFHNLIHPGSQDLQQLFARRPNSNVPLANDTAVGLGYAPMSPLEQLVLAVETRINRRNRVHEHPAWGEDIKVMAVRTGSDVRLTMSCAMVGRYLASSDDYFREKAEIGELVRTIANEHGFPRCAVNVNQADDPQTGTIYLTVTGTSAEAGDDGQVGRGNRANGLITPYRPMIMEAIAGKNPVTHIGKIYNVLAGEIARSLVAEPSQITAAQCLLMGQIGAPVTEPALTHIRLSTRDGTPAARFRKRVVEVAREHVGRAHKMVDGFIESTIEVF
ncbi:MAG: S-adenosylmethionine synthetase [Alphaproteobacteria bacterium]|nr:MAG: S-adenosylmethionine synthetase [Alphaproteobacteria bacterium]